MNGCVVSTFSINECDCVVFANCHRVCVACFGAAAKVGKRRGIEKDHRSCLFFCLIRIIDIYFPKYLFFENVGSLAALTTTWTRVLAMLSERQYELFWLILPVPQGLIRRTRFFLHGKRKGAEPFPLSSCFKAVATSPPPWMSSAPPPEEHRMLLRSEYGKVADRLKMIGNLVVPHQGRFAFNVLTQQVS